MPTFAVEENWRLENTIVDHWRSLKQDGVASQFALDDKLALIRNFLTQRNPGEGQPICTSKRCGQNGILHTDRCHGSKHRGCALLMSSFPGMLYYIHVKKNGK